MANKNINKTEQVNDLVKELLKSTGGDMDDLAMKCSDLQYEMYKALSKAYESLLKVLEKPEYKAIIALSDFTMMFVAADKMRGAPTISACYGGTDAIPIILKEVMRMSKQAMKNLEDDNNEEQEEDDDEYTH